VLVLTKARCHCIYYQAGEIQCRHYKSIAGYSPVSTQAPHQAPYQAPHQAPRPAASRHGQMPSQAGPYSRQIDLFPKSIIFMTRTARRPCSILYAAEDKQAKSMIRRNGGVNDSKDRGHVYHVRGAPSLTTAFLGVVLVKQ
jgi:hypothetical protein